MRCRQHVNPLGLGLRAFRGERPVLDCARPVELEVGCADAQFLFERAQRDPDRLYLGLEIRDQLVDLVNEKARALRAPVQAVFCQANLHIDTVLPPRSVERAYVNFPDPWFKRRHRKRRMIDADLANGLQRVLAPGGEVFVQTDVWELALDALEVFEPLAPELTNLAGAWSFWKKPNPYGARSWREEHCEGAGLKIWRLRYRNQLAAR